MTCLPNQSPLPSEPAGSSPVKVLIVESLSPEDLMDDWREARATADVLRTLGIKSVCQSARSVEDLKSLCKMFKTGKFDVLHIACHGCKDGIGVSDGSLVSWVQFVEMLGDGIQGKMIVISACDGGCSELPKLFAAVQSRPNEIVGPAGKVAWDRLLIGIQVFYRAVFPYDLSERDSPCVAVSRAELAAGPGLVLHQWNEGKASYDVFEPHPLCSLDVMVKVHGEQPMINATHFLPMCCGAKWNGPEALIENMKAYGVSRDLFDLGDLYELATLAKYMLHEMSEYTNDKGEQVSVIERYSELCAKLGMELSREELVRIAAVADDSLSEDELELET